MYVFWIVIAANAGILAAALLVSTWFTLVQPDAEQLKDLEEMGRRSWREALLAFGRPYQLIEERRIAEHWRSRGRTRKFFYLGILVLVLAIIALYFAESTG
jgi:type II secretory pathway component PulM